MKKKELRNVIKKKKIAGAIKTIVTHEHVSRTFSSKNIKWLESDECPWDWNMSKERYNKAKEFLKTVK